MYVGKVRTFNGKLRVQVHEDYRALEYMDSDTSLLESQLAKILAAIESESDKIKERRKNWETREERYEKYEDEDNDE